MRVYDVAFIVILLHCVNVSLSQRSSIEERHLRPSSQQRPCSSGRRCADDYDTKPKDVGANYRPASDDRPNRNYGRPVEDDYRTQPEQSRNDKPKHEESVPLEDIKPIGDDYNRKPITHSVIPTVREEYKPDDKEYRPENDRKPRPDIPEDRGSSREVYPKPDAREEYPKPAIRDEYPMSAIRDEYPKPAIRDEYPKPAGRDEYPKPVAREEHQKPDIRNEYPKPAVRDEYAKPVAREEYPKPAIRDEYPKPAIRDEYPKPGGRDEYPKPAIRDEYPKPAIRDEYPKPGDRDEYPKPAVRDEYPKPASRDEYPNSRYDGYPKTESRDDYSRPVSSSRDDYDKNPVEHAGRPIRKDDYDSKPAIRDDYSRPYNPKPDKEDFDSVSEDHNTRRTFKEDRDRKPVYGDEYDSRPPIRGESNPKPSRSGGGYSYPRPDHSGKDDSSINTRPGSDHGSKTGEYGHDEDQKGKFITSNNDRNCICVPYYQCKDGHIVTDGGGIIDARRRQQPDEDLPLDGKFRPPSCGPFHVCCNTPETSTVKPYEHRCGVRNPSGINSRILSPSNKGEADFGEWPWQAAVLKTEGSVNIFQCGGVLIDNRHVLTVAHCVFHFSKYNDYPIKIRLGEWDTQKITEFLAHEDYKVSKIIIHEEFRNSSLWNDIAILRLQETVLFAPHIDTICLPKYDEIFAGQNCVVTGWGTDSYKSGTFSNIMKEVALQVTDNFNCEEQLRKTRLGSFFQLHEGFLCAGGEQGLDSCKGDGGGPLVCYRKDRSYALAGLVSWGIDCGQAGVPGVYVKVQRYLDWISKNTGNDLQNYWPKS